ncbi:MULTISPECIES: helix-turn-helix domain-containing protein [Xenorhabdus]|uniref:helix-turn-helix domain-containing protein n=1 Tax=Xenorhabdus TaxID=626 RepID=UPI0006495190|nr:MULTISPECIES: helix-turn-helix transcriptional regulator [Xenorhabdus]KLU14172.1 DNA-binding protein [Xenorhabdus griffiniae]KOP32973.1 DNA-binding protein [Xenorhabdus sp. GDc328]
MLTPFGKIVRKMRIDLGITLKEMAESMGMTSSYLSAIETGKRAITDSVLNNIVSYLAKTPGDKVKLKNAAKDSQQSVEINLMGRSANARNAAMSFARSFDDLDEDDFAKLLKLLNAGKKD